MFLLLYLYYFNVEVQAKVAGKLCNVNIEDPYQECYIKEVLVTMPHSPNQLAVDRSTNTIYYSFDTGQGEYIPAAFNIDTKLLTVLKGVKDAFAVASDAVNKLIYFGGSHGMYRYDPIKKTLHKLRAKNLDIWWLFVKRNIYFVQFPNLTAKFYNNRSIISVRNMKSAVNQFVYDVDDNLFYINGSGLFGIKHDSYKSILLREWPRFLGMATDNNGLVYLCSEEGIFVVSNVMEKVQRVVIIEGVLGLTFDKHNNFVYSDSQELVRLLPVAKENFYNIDKNVN